MDTPIIVNTGSEAMTPGKFLPTWESLQQYQVPGWFRDAKFGIWAHWGPQCVPEAGDWYARHMYIQGMPEYAHHLSNYGHPSNVGFKDLIHRWKVDNWNPRELIALYKAAGAQYFVAMANHHDNFDLWNSKHHRWNSTHIGPGKDLIAGWAQAAREQGLRFGVSVHASHAWSWLEVSQGADATGPMAGVPYDGNLSLADGKGTWWEGLDPQELYAQDHTPSPGFGDRESIHPRWEWGNDATLPSQTYCDAFYRRTIDLVRQFKPDLMYFDDTALPLWPASDAGLKIAADFYNSNMNENGGDLQAVLFGKILDEQQRKAMVWDIERGQSSKIEPDPWQTDTCIGNWHYKRELYDNDGYKSAETVVRTLVDIVSKNGNLLLSIPVRADGSIDEKERAIVESIGHWMAIHQEAIFGTRPWHICGEGPQLAAAAPLSRQGFNEGKGMPFTAADIRYTAKGKVLYALTLGRPPGEIRLMALGKFSPYLSRKIVHVEQLGAGAVIWERQADALVLKPLVRDVESDYTSAFRITTE